MRQSKNNETQKVGIKPTPQIILNQFNQMKKLIKEECFSTTGLSQSIQLAMENLNKTTVDNLKVMTSSLQDTVQNTEMFWKNLQKQITLISETYTKALSEMATKLSQTLVALKKEIEEQIEEPEFLNFFEEWGWLEWVPVNIFLFELYFEYKEGNFSFLEDFNKWLSTDEGSRNLLNEILHSKVCNRRQKYIENIFNLHKIGNYISSIPLCLIQIEGIIRDLGILKGYLENRPNPKHEACSNKKTSFGQIVIELYGEKEKLVDKEINQPMTKHLTEEIYSEDLRNAMLHGNKLDYEDPILSAHLIAIILSLAHKATEIEKLSKVQPYWENKSNEEYKNETH